MEGEGGGGGEKKHQPHTYTHHSELLTKGSNIKKVLMTSEEERETRVETVPLTFKYTTLAPHLYAVFKVSARIHRRVLSNRFPRRATPFSKGRRGREGT